MEVKQPQIMKLFFQKIIQMKTSNCYSLQDNDEPLCLPSMLFVYGLSSIVFGQAITLQLVISKVPVSTLSTVL